MLLDNGEAPPTTTKNTMTHGFQNTAPPPSPAEFPTNASRAVAVAPSSAVVVAFVDCSRRAAAAPVGDAAALGGSVGNGVVGSGVVGSGVVGGGVVGSGVGRDVLVGLGVGSALGSPGSAGASSSSFPPAAATSSVAFVM